MKSPLPPQLLLRPPLPEPHQSLHNQENNHYPRRDPQHVSSKYPRPVFRVEEIVDVDSARVMRQVRQRQVEREDQDQRGEVHPWRAGGAGDYELEEGEEGVEGVLGEVGPAGVGGFEPGGVEDGPVDDCDEEGVGDYGGVEEGVERLEGAGEVCEEGGAVACVGEGVKGGEEEVEGESPVC